MRKGTLLLPNSVVANTTVKSDSLFHIKPEGTKMFFVKIMVLRQGIKKSIMIIYQHLHTVQHLEVSLGLFSSFWICK